MIFCLHHSRKFYLTVTLVAVSLVAFALIGCSESKIALADLPLAAQTAIKAKLGALPIDEIEKKSEKGQIFYKVDYFRNEMKIEFKIDGNGKVLPFGHD